MTAKQTARQILYDLREWARIEQTIMDVPDESLKPWREVEKWADGVALKMKIDLRPTHEEKMERQNLAFRNQFPPKPKTKPATP